MPPRPPPPPRPASGPVCVSAVARLGSAHHMRHLVSFQGPEGMKAVTSPQHSNSAPRSGRQPWHTGLLPARRARLPAEPPTPGPSSGGGGSGARGGSQTGSFGWQARCLWPPAFNTGNGSQKNVIFYLSLKMGNSSHISPNSHLATAGCSTQGLPPTWGPAFPAASTLLSRTRPRPAPRGASPLGLPAWTPRERTASPCGRRRKAPVAFS